jgi:SAM-dependent methyltransferase
VLLRGARSAARLRGVALLAGLLPILSVAALAGTPAGDSASPANADLAPKIREIEIACFSAYPADLLERMSGKPGPVPEAVRTDPRQQMKYLMTEKKAEKGLFYPSLLEEYVEAFAAHVGPGTKFLDLGSGDGRVVLLAALLGAEATGIEWDRELHETALRAKDAVKQLVPVKHAALKRGDFFKESFRKYDVVFYFGSGAYEEKRLIGKLRDEMRPGTVLLLAHVPERPEDFDILADYGRDITAYRRSPE